MTHKFPEDIVNMVMDGHQRNHGLVYLDKVLETIDSEEELPGDPPAEIEDAISWAFHERDPDVILRMLRNTVKVTKENIRKRLLDL